MGLIRWTGAVVLIVLATPAFAGMTEDLADCAATNRDGSAAACTRVIASGRLPKEQSYIAHFNRGWSHYYAGAYAKALADFDRAIHFKPDYAETYYSRAVTLHEQGDRVRSQSDLDRYVELKGGDAIGRFNTAVLLRRRGEHELALAQLQAASAESRTLPSFRLLHALVLSDQGHHDRATAEIEDVLVSHSMEPVAYAYRGLVAFRQSRFDDAAKDAARAIEIKPDYIGALDLLGQIEERRERTAEATSYYRRAKAVKVTSVEAHLAKVHAGERLARLEVAPEHVAAGSAPLLCRRFIAAASAVVDVDCGS